MALHFVTQDIGYVEFNPKLPTTGAHPQLGHAYALLHNAGLALISASSPVEGLALNVINGFTLVFFSPETHRLAVYATYGLGCPSTTFSPIISWIAGRNVASVDDFNMTEMQIDAWHHPASCPSQITSIQVAIIEGTIERPQSHIPVPYHCHVPFRSKAEDDQWRFQARDKILNYFDSLRHTRNLRTDLVQSHHSPMLGKQLILVKKGGAITVLQQEEMGLEVDSELTHEPYDRHCRNWNMLTLESRRLGGWPLPHPLYFIDHYTRPQQLSDALRLRLRQGHFDGAGTDEGCSTQFTAFYESIVKHSPSEVMWDVFTSISVSMTLSKGPPCERCTEMGDRLCSRCQGAWYCSHQHQVNDWEKHQLFCRANHIRR